MIEIEVRFPYTGRWTSGVRIDRRCWRFGWRQPVEAWRYWRSARRVWGASNVSVRWF